MTEHAVTVWNTVPALLQMFAEFVAGRKETGGETLRIAMLSGDWIPVGLPAKVKALWPAVSLISQGGATEASIWSISYPIESVSSEWSSIPYGKPLTNQTFHVLTRHWNLVRYGCRGSFILAGWDWPWVIGAMRKDRCQIHRASGNRCASVPDR